MTKNQFSDRIKQLREQKGLTQSELAEKSGLTVRSIQRLEKGDNKPRGDSLKRLSEVFEVSVESLVERKLSDNLLFLIILSLSPLAFLFNPWIGVLAPFVLWLYGRRRIRNVDVFGRRILNFEISWYLVLLFISGILISIANGKIAIAGQINIEKHDELIVFQVFMIFMYVVNFGIIFLNTFSIGIDRKTRFLFGFAFKQFKPRILVIALMILTAISSFVFQEVTKKKFINMDKEEVVQFALKATHIIYQEDRSHIDTLRQYLHPGMDSSQQKFIIGGYNVCGQYDSWDYEVLDYAVKGRLGNYSYYLYLKTRIREQPRFMLEMKRLDDQLYITDYYRLIDGDKYILDAKLKKVKGDVLWIVKTPYSKKGIWKNNRVYEHYKGLKIFRFKKDLERMTKSYSTSRGEF